MPKGIGYGSSGPAPYMASRAPKSSGGSDRSGAVQSPYKGKDKMTKRKFGRGRSRSR